MSARPMTPSADAFAAILAKDLRSELRTLSSLPAMVLFAITTFVIFRFGLDRTTLSGSLAAGVLWATLLFAAILGINRLFVAERSDGGFDAIRLAPIDRTVLLAAKAAGLVIFLAALELVTVPVFAIFFLDSATALGPLCAVLVLADLGLAATGASQHLFEAGGPAYDRFGTWLAVLALYDLVFLLVGYAVFDFLLED